MIRITMPGRVWHIGDAAAQAHCGTPTPAADGWMVTAGPGNPHTRCAACWAAAHGTTPGTPPAMTDAGEPIPPWIRGKRR